MPAKAYTAGIRPYWEITHNAESCPFTVQLLDMAPDKINATETKPPKAGLNPK
jgi:hypothetical protein